MATLELGKCSGYSHHAFRPIIRIDYILQVDAIIRVHFVISQLLTGRGRLFFQSEKAQGTQATPPNPITGVSPNLRVHFFTSLSFTETG